LVIKNGSIFNQDGQLIGHKENIGDFEHIFHYLNQKELDFKLNITNYKPSIPNCLNANNIVSYLLQMFDFNKLDKID